jgi:hypothetical protein
MFPGDSLTIPVDPCECEWTKTFETEQGTLQGLYRVCVGGCGAVTDWPDVSAQACAAKDCFMKHLQLSLMILIISQRLILPRSKLKIEKENFILYRRRAPC